MLLILILAGTSTCLAWGIDENKEESNPFRSPYTSEERNEYGNIESLSSIKTGGGEVVESPTTYPFTAVVNKISTNNGKDSMSFCSGVILDKRHVLTAAHCVCKWEPGNICKLEDPTSYFVLVGPTIDYLETDQKPYTAKQVFVHFNYNNSIACINNFDIAVVRLVEELEFSNTVVKATFPKPALPETIPELSDKTCVVLGYGYIPTVESNLRIKLESLKPKFSDCRRLESTCDTTRICIEAPNSHTTYLGDDGGPLMCDGQLFGIASHAYRVHDHYGAFRNNVFERVDTLVNWLTVIMNFKP